MNGNLGEPAAWQRYSDRLGWTIVDAEYAKHLAANGETVRPLYAAEELLKFAESFHFTVTDSFYKDAYLGIHEPDSVTIRLVNNSLESAHIAKLEERRKHAVSAAALPDQGSTSNGGAMHR